MIYKCLNQQVFENGNFKIVPIRMNDRHNILIWRNEQIYHLRQNKPLTTENQNHYFDNIVAKLFDQEKPNQILFSYLENDICIGYGGLVHINWIDKNAEISFIMKTELEEIFFRQHWQSYLKLIEKVAFQELKFHKIFTYAFDIRPKLYIALENCGFTQEARLKEHCFFDNKFIDVVIHKKIAENLKFRKAEREDCECYFNWTNDQNVREQSFSSEEISFENHTRWFLNKIEDENSLLLIFQNHFDENIGQVRIQKNDNKNALIGLSVAKEHRGNGYAAAIIEIASNIFLAENQDFEISAFIKQDNLGSKKSFENANFKLKEIINYENFMSFHFIKKY